MQDVEKLTVGFSKVLTDNNANIVKTEQWGLRDLAYVIRKNNKGYYTMLAIDGPFHAVKEMERRMSLNENILRHLTVKVEKISKNPSPIIARSSGEENVEKAAEETSEE